MRDPLHPDVARALADGADRWRALLDHLGCELVTTPSAETADGRCYYTDAEGARWRVHDCTFSGGKPRRVALGATLAAYRYFVAQDGTMRVAELKAGADRRLEVATLAAQLRGATYASRELHTPAPAAPGRFGS